MRTLIMADSTKLRKNRDIAHAILILLRQGLPIAKIARSLRVHPATVYRIRSDLEKGKPGCTERQHAESPQ